MNSLEDVSVLAIAQYIRNLGIVADRANKFSTNVSKGCRDVYEKLKDHLPPMVFKFRTNFEKLCTDLEDCSYLEGAVLRVANKLASGFESEKFPDNKKVVEDSFLLSLCEQVQLDKTTNPKFKYAHSVSSLTNAALFPKRLTDLLKKKDVKHCYEILYRDLISSIADTDKGQIFNVHKDSLDLWIDHFDTAMLTFTSLIPTVLVDRKYKNDVSLYDHAKVAAAFTTALYRYHLESDKKDINAIVQGKDKDEKKFVLIQGDFFSIQQFIFSDGSETNKSGAKLLRGRSFYVSLMTELAALKLMDELELPATCQILNAAGKFILIAPNTDSTKRAIKKVQKELSDWFLKNTFGLTNVGIVSTEASSSDFADQQYDKLSKRMYRDLEKLKLQSFDLTNMESAVLTTSYQHGVCSFNGLIPADGILHEDHPSCAISRDQIMIGKRLASAKTIFITRNQTDRVDFKSKLDEFGQLNELPIFGYSFGFLDEHFNSKFNRASLETEHKLARYWDISMIDGMDKLLFNGCARRNINAYIPYFSDLDIKEKNKYHADIQEFSRYEPKTFSHIACEDRRMQKDGTWIGEKAITVLKGDIDDLGATFQVGLNKGNAKQTFAKMCSLSRIINAFFACYLPTLCKTEFRNVYTVFAGGDDFFIIGPWYTVQKLGLRMREEFQRYTANNEEMHFSSGFVTVKPSFPLPTLAEFAECALEQAKSFQTNDGHNKNAVTLFGQTVSWKKFDELFSKEEELEKHRDNWGLSAVFLYSLFSIIDLSSDKNNPAASIWRSKLHYRVARIMEQKYQGNKEDIQRNANELIVNLVKGIEKYGATMRIPLTNLFYKQRDN